MKKRFLSLAVLLAANICAQQVTAACAGDVAVKSADAVIVRPLGLASTLVGSILFVFSLPVTAPLKKTKSTAELLVVKPAKATFVRPLGNMDAMGD